MNSLSDSTSYTCAACTNPKCSACPADVGTCTVCYGSPRTASAGCACPADGYYDAFAVADSATYNCQPCTNNKCKTCSSTSASVCDVCVGTNRNLPGCTCSVGFFDAFALGNAATFDCVACTNAKCYDCASTSASVCDTCFGLGRDNTNACACPDNGYYDAF